MEFRARGPPDNLSNTSGCPNLGGSVSFWNFYLLAKRHRVRFFKVCVVSIHQSLQVVQQKTCERCVNSLYLSNRMLPKIALFACIFEHATPCMQRATPAKWANASGDGRGTITSDSSWVAQQTLRAALTSLPCLRIEATA